MYSCFLLVVCFGGSILSVWYSLERFIGGNGREVWVINVLLGVNEC